MAMPLICRLVLPVAGALAVPGALAATQVQTYAGVVAGNASGVGPFACSTSSVTVVGNGWSDGLLLPTEGIAGCNLSGGVDNRSAAGGLLQAHYSASGPMVAGTGTYTGTAAAQAAPWRLGVAVAGTATGSTSSGTYHQSAAFASFTDTLTLHASGVAAGSAGSVGFGFLIEGLMQSLPHAPFNQQTDVALGLRVNGGPVSNSFRATIVQGGLPFLRGATDDLPGGFVSGPGSLSGASLVNTNATFSIQWDVPFTVEVAFRASTHPCCAGASASAEYLDTAVLRQITAYGPGGEVSNFAVAAETGALLSAGGLTAPVPEPATALLAGLGLAVLATRARKAQATATP